jgi:3-oxoacyl-[acyl-carrier protein] reductase
MSASGGRDCCLPGAERGEKDMGMVLQGRTAIVTGGSRGIGEAIAVKLAQQGARVVIAARTGAALAAASARARETDVTLIPVVADVSRAEDVARLVDAALRETGTIDVLVNCAGIYGPIGPFAGNDLTEWWRAMEINLGGVLRATQGVVGAMMRQRRGKIINLSGGGATAPLPNLTAYAVSKAAVVRLTETLAEELRDYNIQVNAIAPGAVDTKIQDQLLEAGERAGRELYARMKRMRETGEGATPPHVAAELAVFLSSDASNGLTGKLISAPHDPWRQWTAESIAELAASPMFTLRRLDPFTLRPLKDKF